MPPLEKHYSNPWRSSISPTGASVPMVVTTASFSGSKGAGVQYPSSSSVDVLQSTLLPAWLMNHRDANVCPERHVIMGTNPLYDYHLRQQYEDAVGAEIEVESRGSMFRKTSKPSTSAASTTANIDTWVLDMFTSICNCQEDDQAMAASYPAERKDESSPRQYHDSPSSIHRRRRPCEHPQQNIPPSSSPTTGRGEVMSSSTSYNHSPLSATYSSNDRNGSVLKAPADKADSPNTSAASYTSWGPVVVSASGPPPISLTVSSPPAMMMTATMSLHGMNTPSPSPPLPSMSLPGSPGIGTPRKVVGVAVASPRRIPYPIAKYPDRLNSPALVEQRRKSLRRLYTFVPVQRERSDL